MNPVRRHRLALICTGTAVLVLGAGLARAAVQQQPTGPVPDNYTVVAGWGDHLGVANIFTPATLEVYVGDTVTWKIGGSLEPHTITFGPPKLLDTLASNFVARVPQKVGPPIVALNSMGALPTRGTTYDGVGYANSGLLAAKGQSWKLTFTKPGTFRYFCLVHYQPGPYGLRMGGTIIVHARPPASHVYHVSMGSADDTVLSGSDAFLPRRLVIHAGDTVVWSGFFHTVTFGPEAVRNQLERDFLVRVRQAGGSPLLAFNPRVVLPSGSHTYDGTGFVNSGLLQGSGSTPPTFRLTFTRPGTFTYDCLIHPGMDGTITVLPAGRS
jgi:plastocyanin